ncbi:MAG TPA: chorismate lyase [Methylophilaceae bacterium]|nr:chorismate lyase [Methylophilaceae bacterium]
MRWLRSPMGSGAYRHWLVDGGSLTRRLQRRCTDFAVQGVRLTDARPRLDEAGLLCTSSRRLALLREVRLLCAGRPVVFAHSVLPHTSLRGPWLGLARLGERPLGGQLFADPRVVRTPLEYKKLHPHHALYRRATAHLNVRPLAIWARRSVFSLGCAAILVTEVFLPQVLE